MKRSMAGHAEKRSMAGHAEKNKSKINRQDSHETNRSLSDYHLKVVATVGGGYKPRVLKEDATTTEPSLGKEKKRRKTRREGWKKRRFQKKAKTGR
jgi:hypothetical protein